ncbi:NAD(P)/FAD-dependent oxidoreductase [Xanthobacter autotrophicus DSM 431]|uniref:flavin-containing monooxygenase n=1 Tax=Xanthobacter nonsaccharivorans TaxID=3119912 RepID=UPI00372AF08B
MANKVQNDAADFDVIIVGAGFAGIYQLYHLRNRGYNVRLIEAGSDVGGVWHWNCYPGARVDTIGAIYQYSDPILWKDWDYSEKFPAWNELREYFNYVDSKWDVRKDCKFNTRVTGATFDDEHNVWRVQTSTGEMSTCRFFILCTGFAAKPVIPDFPGRDSFKGEAHHTGLWPQGGVDFKGKRVGVIGTGASAVQVIQEASKEAAQLTVFQRTANLTIPMRQQKISKAENARLKEKYPEMFATRARTFAGFEFDFLPHGAMEVSEEERQATFRKVWKTGAFNWWLGNFNDVLVNEDANNAQYSFWREETRKRIKNPALHEKLAPTNPPHPYGVKRPCLEQWYYECFNQENVTLVDLKEAPLERITETGIVAGGEEYPLDVIVYATGFDAVSGGLVAIDIKGTDGRSLREHWANGIKTHLGVASPKFPNLLFLYGPQSPSGFCNGPTCAELQGDWLLKFIEDMDQNGIKRVEAKPDAADAWAEDTKKIIDMTLFPRANSWYLGANIPGKPREILVYPGGLPTYLDTVNNVAAKGYSGFALTK